MPPKTRSQTRRPVRKAAAKAKVSIKQQSTRPKTAQSRKRSSKKKEAKLPDAREDRRLRRDEVKSRPIYGPEPPPPLPVFGPVRPPPQLLNQNGAVVNGAYNDGDPDNEDNDGGVDQRPINLFPSNNFWNYYSQAQPQVPPHLPRFNNRGVPLTREEKIADALTFDGQIVYPGPLTENMNEQAIEQFAEELALIYQPWILHLHYQNGDVRSLPLYYNSHGQSLLRSIFGRDWGEGFTRNELPDVIKFSGPWGDILDEVDSSLSIQYIQFEAYTPAPNRPNNSAAFYAHRHTCSELIPILEKHQIFHTEQKRPDQEEHCLIQALRNAGISEEKLTSCKEFIRGTKSYVKTTAPQLEKIEKFLNINIVLCVAEKSKNQLKCRRRNLGQRPNVPTIELALLDKHLMFNEKLPNLHPNYMEDREHIIAEKGLSHPKLLKHYADRNEVVSCDHRDSDMTLFRLVSQLMLYGYIDTQQVDICPVVAKVDIKTVQLTQELIDMSYLKKDAKKKGRKSENKEEEEAEEEEQAEEEEEEEDRRKSQGAARSGLKEIYFAADFESFVNEHKHRACLAGVTELVALDALASSEPQDYRKVTTEDFGELFTRYRLFKPRNEEEEVGHEQSAIIVRELTEYLCSKICFLQRTGKQTTLPVCFFHNLRYDMTVYLSDCGYRVKNIVRRGGTIYSMQIFQGSSGLRGYIEFRDSAKLFGPGALAQCPAKFQLPDSLVKKEAINYKYYGRGPRNRLVSVREYSESKSFVSETDRIAFEDRVLENLKTCLEVDVVMQEDDEVEPLRFNPWQYYEYYLKYDVVVLAASLCVYRRDFCSLTDGIDPLQSLSVSSLISKVCKQNGCFDNVLPVSCILRKFLQQSVYGGRVCVHPDYELRRVEGTLQYLDGVSLYPSAMVELSKAIGLPTGKAQLLGAGEDPWQYPHFTVQVRITAARKSQASGIQFLCKRPTKTSVRDEENEVKAEEAEEEQEVEGLQYVGEFDIQRGDEPIVCVLDRITLEDYIEFHQIEYTVLQGVYWPGEPNRKWGNVIQEWFNLRLRYKQSGNKGMDTLLKLGMNSAYGRTILRSVDEQNVYKDRDGAAQTFLSNNFVTIKEFKDVGQESVEFTMEETDHSFTMPHAGSLVLSMSKRIMNRVMNCLSDLSSPIYYTDTDSMCIEDTIIPSLEALYNERYPYLPPLNGEGLCQFHSDFSVKGCQSIDIFSKRGYFIGKKMYLHILQATDSKNKILEWYKMSFKGVTQASLQHLASQFDSTRTYLGSEYSYIRGLELAFQQLIDGKALRALQNPPGEKQDLFLYSKGCVAIQTSSKPFYKCIGTKTAVREMHAELRRRRRLEQDQSEPVPKRVRLVEVPETEDEGTDGEIESNQ